MGDLMEHDPSVGIIAQSVAKVIFYICMTVVLCFWFSSCGVDGDMITICRDSCSKGFGGHMESVTARECVCAPVQNIETTKNDVWVLPKK
jgi:hypothetical protein